MEKKYTEMNVWKKLQLARRILQDKEPRMSGHVAFKAVKYDYFENADFMPHVNKIFDDIGLIGVTQTLVKYKKKIGEKSAKTQDKLLTEDIFEEIEASIKLTIINTDNLEERIDGYFQKIIKKFNLSGSGEAQEAEASNTFAKRNLWIEVMALTENDIVNQREPEYINEKQLEEIKKIAKEAKVTEKQLITAYKIKDLSELLVENYDGCIKKLNVTIKNNKAKDDVKNKAKDDVKNENKDNSNGK